MGKNKELAKNTMIISIGKLCTQFLGFILLPLYTSLLNTVEYGAVDLVSTYVQLLLPLVLLQMDQALLRFIIDDRSNNDKISIYITSTFVFLLTQTILFTIIFFIVKTFVYIDFSVYLYLTLLVTSLTSVSLQIARGFGDNITYSFSSFLCGASTIILNVLLIVVYHMKTEGMLLSVIVGNIITFLYILLKLQFYRYFSIKKYNHSFLKKMLIYAFPLVPNALMWWFINASDRMIVLYFCGTSYNGILAIAHKFPALITTFYNIFHISWVESASLHLKERDKDEFFSGVFDTVYRVFFAMTICMIGIMPFVFNLFININYAEAYYQIPIYAGASLFNVVVGLYSVIYIYKMKTLEIAKTSLYSGIINIVIDFILIRDIGLFAASISSFIAFGSMALYRAKDIRKYINQKINYKLLIDSIILFVGISSIYYSNIRTLQLIALIASIIYSVTINKSLIKSIFIKVIHRGGISE